MTAIDSTPSSAFSSIDSPEALLAAARRQGLELVSSATALDGMGLDFLVLDGTDERGQRWIVRTPRRRDVVTAARVEARVLAFVKPHLPVAVPDWRVFADDVIAYPRLDGTPAVTMGADGPVWSGIEQTKLSQAFLSSFADALLALQACPIAGAEQAGVPVQTIASARATLREHMEVTRAALEPSQDAWRGWLEWLNNDALWPTTLVMTHGDLHPGHLLLDGETRVTGILDWTEGKVADPALDLAMFYGCFQRAGLDALIAELERRGQRYTPELLLHVTKRWDAFPITGAEYALRTNNEDVLRYLRQQVAQRSS